MCGIAGKLDFRGRVVDPDLVKKMCDTLIHRGPDDGKVHTGPYIGLGQRRLSIIDLRSSATAPLPNEDETIWVIFNGEIYNFQELRSTLKTKGHVFRTGTDTEVIIHLYEEYGYSCLDHMVGMFAFALWDSRHKILFAARDRFGKKPFYYTNTGTSLVFGSAVSALIADPEVSCAPNFAALDAYLNRQYVPSPITAFSNISKLPAGHYLSCSNTGELIVTRYWSPPSEQKISASEQEISIEILRLLRESVRSRLISDVPIGALLSGGIDSGAVVALMAQESPTQVKTFSIDFGDPETSELPYAKQVAQKYGTEHHEFTVKPAAMEMLPVLVRHFNEPFADPSAVPTYYVSQVARQHVTVALTGDGGDESFAGYGHYQQVLAWQKFDHFPYALRNAVFGSAARVFDGLPYSNLLAKISRGCRMAASNLPGRYFIQLSVLKSQERRAAYTRHFESLIRSGPQEATLWDPPWRDDMDSLDWMMRHDQAHYLPDCLMVKADITSMANSLELRAPLLDHRLVAFASSIPSAMKRDSTGGKLILKKAVRGLLPPDILAKKKTGFRPPIANWFRDDLSEMLRSVLLGEKSRKRDLLNPSFLKKMIDEHVCGKRDWSTRLWAFLFLELWFQEFID